MQLTEQQLDEGRACLREANLDSLDKWIDFHGIRVDRAGLRRSLEKILKADPDRAMKLFDRVFVGVDPQKERRVANRVAGCTLFAAAIVLLGCLGGILYIFRVLF